MKKHLKPKTFFTYLIVLLASIIFSFIIWTKFLRDILCNLSIWGYLVLIEIALIYLYIFFFIVKPNKYKGLLYVIIDRYNISRDKLYYFVSNALLTFKLWKEYHSFILRHIKFITDNINQIYFLFRIIPILILIFTLLIDIFIFRQLFYIYKILLVGLFVFLPRFYIYTIKIYKKQLLKQLETVIKWVRTDYVWRMHGEFDLWDDDDDMKAMSVSLEQYLELKVRTICNNDTKFDYKYFISTKEHYKILAQLPIEEANEQEKLVYNKIKNLVDLSVLLKEFDWVILVPMYRLSLIFIFFFYTTCWLFVLFSPIHTLNILEVLQMLDVTWKEIKEPFSGLDIQQHERYENNDN